jgi:hypothetical protein
MTNKFKKRTRAFAVKTGMKYEAAHRASQKNYPPQIFDPTLTVEQKNALKRFWAQETSPWENNLRKSTPGLVDPEVKLTLFLSYLTTLDGRRLVIEAMRRPIQLLVEKVTNGLKESTWDGLRWQLMGEEEYGRSTLKGDRVYILGLFKEFRILRDLLFAFAPKAEHQTLENALELTCEWGVFETIDGALKNRIQELFPV